MLAVASCQGATSHGETVTATGAWRLPPQFQYHLDAPLAEAVAKLLQAEGQPSVLDIGAGKGLYVRYLRAHGLAAYGLDGATDIANITSGLVAQRDLTLPLQPCAAHDWALSLEVAEHIPRAAEATYLRNLNCSARNGLIVSWAPPGQAGSGHVNLRTAAEARAKLESLGLAVDELATRSLLAAATMPWFRRNLIVLRRPARSEKGQARSVETHALVPAEGRAPAPAAPTMLAAADLIPARALFAKLRVAAAELAPSSALGGPLDALEAELSRLGTHTMDLGPR